MDPVLLVLLSGVGGAALTAGAGFFGAWLQGRREHKRWLREQRYAAYLRLLAMTREGQSLVGSKLDPPFMAKAVVERTLALVGSVSEIGSSVMLLGPDSVSTIGQEFLQAFRDDKHDEQGLAKIEWRLIDEMRRVLRIEA